jgi:hypothetical protein
MGAFISPAEALRRAIQKPRRDYYDCGPAIRQDRRVVHHNGAAVRVGSAAGACQQVGGRAEWVTGFSAYCSAEWGSKMRENIPNIALSIGFASSQGDKKSAAEIDGVRDYILRAGWRVAPTAQFSERIRLAPPPPPIWALARAWSSGRFIISHWVCSSVFARPPGRVDIRLPNAGSDAPISWCLYLRLQLKMAIFHFKSEFRSVTFSKWSPLHSIRYRGAR